MWSIGIMLFAVIGSICTFFYLLYLRKKQTNAIERIQNLQVQQDTAKILEDHKREQVERTWEEFDRQQWDKRFTSS